VAQKIVEGLNVFTFLSVPFFILAGDIMGEGGISERLIRLSNALVGWLRGGLAMVNIMASMFFGGISGSATADTASLGSILIPIMKKNGYDTEFSTTVTMASSIQGLLIPPSHNMVIFAMAAGGLSVGRLFLAGMIPGIFLGVVLMVYSYFVSLKKNYPVGDPFRPPVLLKALSESFFGLGTVLIVVFGVLTGIFTPTESAAIAVVYALIVSFLIYREVTFGKLWDILGKTLQTLSVVMVLIAAASAFGWIIAYLRIPNLIAESILGFTSNKYLILFIINIVFLVLGTMMGMASIILITTPILLPIILRVGIDPIHLGIIMIFNLGIGLITPPVGAVLFIGSAISGLKVESLTKAMVPFYIVMFGTLLVVTYVPELVLFIPKILMP
jgi:tripartite ATP-independent transporter DctM subunit